MAVRDVQACSPGTAPTFTADDLYMTGIVRERPRQTYRSATLPAANPGSNARRCAGNVAFCRSSLIVEGDSRSSDIGVPSPQPTPSYARDTRRGSIPTGGHGPVLVPPPDLTESAEARDGGSRKQRST